MPKNIMCLFHSMNTFIKGKPCWRNFFYTAIQNCPFKIKQWFVQHLPKPLLSGEFWNKQIMNRGTRLTIIWIRKTVGTVDNV